MTDHTDLIARLRKDDLFWEAPITCRSEAADALQAAQAEIEAQQHRIQSLWMERDVALARLAELTKQEPVGYLYDWVHSSATGRDDETYTGFTKDKAHAEKHDNAIAIYAAAGASPVQPSQGLQSVADALTIEQLNDKVERLMAVQPSQAPTCDLRGIDAGPLSEWVDLVRRGYVAKDECLIAVKDVPKWLAQNQPSQALELSDDEVLGIYAVARGTEIPHSKHIILSIYTAIIAAINAKESGK